MTLYSFLRIFILKPFFKIMFRFKVYGVENLPKNSAFILASNHVSFLDPVALGIASPVELHYMAKENLFCNKFIKKFFNKINMFPVKRESHDAGAIKEAIKRLKAGCPLVIFPEGGRSADGSLKDAKLGAGFLAYLAGVPVVPAFIKGSQRALPKHSKLIRPERIAIYFGKPIFPETDIANKGKKESYQNFTQTVMEQIKFLAH